MVQLSSTWLLAAKVEDETKDLLALCEVKAFPAIRAFDRAYRGFWAFCGLFGQPTSKNKNILTDLKNGEIYYFISGHAGYCYYSILEIETSEGKI